MQNTIDGTLWGRGAQKIDILFFYNNNENVPLVEYVASFKMELESGGGVTLNATQTDCKQENKHIVRL